MASQKTSFMESLFGAPAKPTKKEKEEEANKKNPLISGESLDPTNGKKRFYLIIESMQSGVEKYYFYFLRNMQATNFFGMKMKVEKVRDIFGAGEASSLWGGIEQRKSIQQEKASQFLGTIGNMIKSLFQILRELRIMEERMEYYTKSKAGDNSAEVALKGIWVDMVEGGAKNPASIYGLAQQVGFVTLPDLFYHITCKNADAVDDAIKSLKSEGLNRKIREVLARKLKQYYIWKEKTEKEMATRKRFVLSYLRQHFNVIKMYTSWVRPYLENVQRLQMQQSRTDVDIVSAFETSKIELELMGISKGYSVEDQVSGESFSREFKKYFPVNLVKFKHVALPQMAFQQEYQRGPIHTGRTEIQIEAYVATKDQIDAYKKFKDREDMELLASVNSAMDALKEELDYFLDQAMTEEEKAEKEKEKKELEEGKAREGFLTPYTAVIKGFGDLFGGLKPAKKVKKEEGEVTAAVASTEQGEAKRIAAANAWQLYNVFKKVHGMYTP